jgi:hypothetical protein
MIAALVIGTLLAVGALAFVLYPVFFGVARSDRRTVSAAPATRETAVAALREIEFDRETGKLSETDYAELKARYTQEAIYAMRREQMVGASGAALDDEIEAAVRAYRREHASCPTCGPRPEPDAVFCSTCGRYLRDRCAGCGAPVDALDARYCVNCGNRLAA